jgi:hypothetical protein
MQYFKTVLKLYIPCIVIRITIYLLDQTNAHNILIYYLRRSEMFRCLKHHLVGACDANLKIQLSEDKPLIPGSTVMELRVYSGIVEP